MTYSALDSFYLTEKEIQNSPSRKDGVDEETETSLRIYGCDLIQQSGTLLNLPQAAMATAQVLFHRFYFKKSFVRFDAKLVAAGCIWLASKTGEDPRHSHQVLSVFHRLLDLEFSMNKAALVKIESELLVALGFVCHVQYPHMYILNYLAALGTPSRVSQCAWNFANDILQTTLCVRLRSEVIACGCIYAAARKFRFPLPENPPWWEVFDAHKSGIDLVCTQLASLYSRKICL